MTNPSLRAQLKGKKVALLGHPASMSSPHNGFIHSLDALASCSEFQLSAAFGPQHGIRGDKQDNMVESDFFIDPIYHIPMFSLYGTVRKLTDEMMDCFDVLLFDIQDIGCRIYTFLTTLLYVIEGCAHKKKSLWILDRPNPAGRPIEGMSLEKGWESFVGAAAGIPMRHGMTMAEMAQWFIKNLHINIDLYIVPMKNYHLQTAPGYGWPLFDLPWVNPSPNAATLSMARAYSGTVLIEGTTLSEGRGTTHPLEIQGAPDIHMQKILAWMVKNAPEWLTGCLLRPCYFEPTFHKHQKKLNWGFQIHVDHTLYQHTAFKPYRIIALWFKAIRSIYPDYPLWRSFPYEYESDRLAINLINGGPKLKQWVDDKEASIFDFEHLCTPDEKAWEKTRQPFLLYS